METRDFLLEDYKVKVQYLSDHLSRMWTRFNFLLTLNSGLFAFSVQKDTATFGLLFTLAGVVLSILWYVFGANDNYLVEVYRKQVECSYTLLGLKKELQTSHNPNEVKYYSYAGDAQDKLIPNNMRFLQFLQWLRKGDRNSELDMNFLEWRWKRGKETTSPHYLEAIIAKAVLFFLIIPFLTLFP